VDENPAFWEALGGKKPIAEANTAGDDLEFENAVGAALKLYRVCDSTGELEGILLLLLVLVFSFSHSPSLSPSPSLSGASILHLFK
jgi:hypothetical protein